MRDWPLYVALAAFLVFAVAIPVTVELGRWHDCRHLGHGPVYCLFLYGGR